MTQPQQLQADGKQDAAAMIKEPLPGDLDGAIEQCCTHLGNARPELSCWQVGARARVGPALGALDHVWVDAVPQQCPSGRQVGDLAHP